MERALSVCRTRSLFRVETCEGTASALVFGAVIRFCWKGKRLKNRAAYFGVFTALALIFSYVETLIPVNLGIPGAKLGLANLVIVIVLYKTGFKEALLLSVTRVVLAGFLFGNLFGILYGLAGAVLSLAAMESLKLRSSFSVVGVSIAGGVSHNIGQLIVAMIVVETYQVGYYLPVLLAAGVVTGALIGIVCREVLRRINNVTFV